MPNGLKTVLAALGLLMVAQWASADFMSGSSVMERCENTESRESGANVSKYNACVMYLAGIADATQSWQRWGDLKPQVCIPETANVEQLRRVFLRYMRKYPEKWHVSAGSLALNAYLSSFPCEK